jgi:hypothetical protein
MREQWGKEQPSSGEKACKGSLFLLLGQRVILTKKILLRSFYGLWRGTIPLLSNWAGAEQESLADDRLWQ